MENKKQTAVEWFLSELERMQYFIGNDMLQAFKQAKAMEKEQIVDAVNVGFEEGCKFPEDIKLKNAEQYYNETYGKQ